MDIVLVNGICYSRSDSRGMFTRAAHLIKRYTPTSPIAAVPAPADLQSPPVMMAHVSGIAAQLH